MYNFIYLGNKIFQDKMYIKINLNNIWKNKSNENVLQTFKTIKSARTNKKRLYCTVIMSMEGIVGTPTTLPGVDYVIWMLSVGRLYVDRF